MSRLNAPKSDGQRGQVLPIFALAAVFMVGVVSLAVDYGFLTDQHRNLQAFADHAAIAGAQQLKVDGSAAANARRYALIYIRDNLGISRAAFDLSGSTAPCANGTLPNFTDQPMTCKLPSPYDNYTVQIRSPGTYSQANGTTALSLSVSIDDSVTNAMSAVIGAPKTTVGAYAEARTQPPGVRVAGALYTDGCLNTSTSSLVGTPLIVDGDTYINQCTIAQSGLTGGFCSFPTPTSSGNLIFGPTSNPPTGLSLGVGLGCSVPLPGGLNLGLGNSFQVPTNAFPPGLPAPPQGPDTCGSEPFGCAPKYLCKNGTVLNTGVPSPNTCYDPGVYKNNPLKDVRNNLNPGVYYVDISSGGCYNDSSVTSCGGVYFQRNTMNANINGIIHKCWNNGPAGGFGLTAASQTFNSPCPDGLIYDPTTPVDPMCNPTGIATTPAASPAFAASPTAGLIPIGSLGNGQTYSLRVSALSALGESDAPDAAELTVTTTITGSITVNITRSANATGYNIYIGSAGREAFVATVAQPLLLNPAPVNITSLPAAGAVHYPLFDNSSCTAGFHNIPHSKDQVPGSPCCTAPNQNFGVTFVLTGKAGLCMGTDSGDQHCVPNLPAPGITVLLQPYCSAGFTPQPESLNCSGSGVAGPNLEDGVYPVYGNSEGAIRTSPSLSCGLLCLTPTTGLMGMTGTVYLPRGSIVEDTGSMFTDTPGEIIIHDVTSNLSLGLLTPLSYASSSAGAFLPPGVALVQ